MWNNFTLVLQTLVSQTIIHTDASKKIYCQPQKIIQSHDSRNITKNKNDVSKHNNVYKK